MYLVLNWLEFKNYFYLRQSWPNIGQDRQSDVYTIKVPIKVHQSDLVKLSFVAIGH